MKRSLWFGLVLTLALGATSLAAVPVAATGDEGCTPGYWKQPHHLAAWEHTGIVPNYDFDDLFGVDFFDPNITVMQALWLQGDKTGINKLAAHAVAAMLNGYTTDFLGAINGNDVRAMVAAVNKGSKPAVIALKNTFADANELGCPL